MKFTPEMKQEIEAAAKNEADKVYESTPGFPGDKEWPALKAHYAFKNGASFMLRKVLEDLRSKECDKFIGLDMRYYGGRDGEELADWLEAHYLKKESGE